ncbi:MAG: hypothetical protein HPY76_11215 [Anaerolineae bacterium]|nr:hypothetical protein [Anaerolineae bacterium]
MSADVDLFIEHPNNLSFDLGSMDIRQHYRLVDAPLTRTTVGIARMVTSKPDLSSDWDWSKSWEENKLLGALPSNDLLWLARLATAIFVIPGLYFFYLSLKEVSANAYIPILGIILLASNPLILLHTRRAMAEALLFFTVCLNMWLMTRKNNAPYSLAAGAALAFSAKQTAAVYLISNLWILIKQTIKSIKGRTYFFRSIIGYLITLSIIIFLLNPVAWFNPRLAIAAAIEARTATIQAQTNLFEQVAPGLVLDDFGERLSALLANQYYLQPAIADVPNYVEDTQSQSESYFSQKIHRNDNSLVFGSIQLILVIFGMILAIFEQLRYRNNYQLTTNFIILTIFQFIFLMIFLRFPFQRYVIPLIPLNIFWCTLALDRLIDRVVLVTTRKRGIYVAKKLDGNAL